MRRIEIDLRNISTKEELHEMLQEKLNFPSYYGKNLDALADVLGDINEQTELVIIGEDEMFSRLGAYGESFKNVLDISARESDEFSVIYRK